MAWMRPPWPSKGNAEGVLRTECLKYNFIFWHLQTYEILYCMFQASEDPQHIQNVDIVRRAMRTPSRVCDTAFVSLKIMLLFFVCNYNNNMWTRGRDRYSLFP
jgi:hypothetical protein